MENNQVSKCPVCRDLIILDIFAELKSVDGLCDEHRRWYVDFAVWQRNKSKGWFYPPIKNNIDLKFVADKEGILKEMSIGSMSEWIKCLKCGRLWDSYLPGYDNICFVCHTPEEIREFHEKSLNPNEVSGKMEIYEEKSDESTGRAF